TALDGRKSEHHREAREQQHKGADRRVRHVEGLARQRSIETAILVDHVGRDERAEEHAVRREERPHQELAVVEARARVWVLECEWRGGLWRGWRAGIDDDGC